MVAYVLYRLYMMQLPTDKSSPSETVGTPTAGEAVALLPNTELHGEVDVNKHKLEHTVNNACDLPPNHESRREIELGLEKRIHFDDEFNLRSSVGQFEIQVPVEKMGVALMNVIRSSLH